jgi:hypothetical protein
MLACALVTRCWSRRAARRPLRGAVAAAVAATVVLGSACGSDPPDPDRPGQESVVKPSGIRRAVVPELAELDQAASGPGREVYRIPTFGADDVAQFYQREMPAKKPFKGMAWCSETQAGTEPATTYEYVWRAGAKSDFLVVQVAGSADGVAISISDEKGNAARTCQAG